MNSINFKKIPKSLFVMILFFSTSILSLIPIFIFNINIENITISQNAIITLTVDLILASILIFLYRRELKKDLKDLKKNFYSLFETSFKYWFVGLMLMMASNIFINLVFPNAVSGNENSVQELISVQPLVMLITAGIIGPIIEELVFRTSIRDVFKNKYLFIGISGLLFGFLHVIFAAQSLVDYIYALPYCFLGLSFAYMVDKTDNNLSSIMMHMMHNFVLVCLSIFMG